MAIRVKWDEYETALLIDTFWKIENNHSKKKEFIVSLSADLRQKAINEGITIDDKYRNVNGISMQLSPIAHGFFPERPALTSSAMFDKMVDMYKNDRTAFNRYLTIAKGKVYGAAEMVDTQTVVLSFEEWINENKSKKYTATALISALKEADAYIADHKMSKKSIFENDNVSEVSLLLSKIVGMRFYRIMHPITSKVLDEAAPLLKKYLVYKGESGKAIPDIAKAEDSSKSKIVALMTREEPQSIEKYTELTVEESFAQVIEYLSTRYSIELSYDRWSGTEVRNHEILNKVQNDVKDVIWVYYINGSCSHYISVETEPEYIANIDITVFDEVTDRDMPPRQILVFRNYNRIASKLVEICDSIDQYFQSPVATKATTSNWVSALLELIKNRFPYGFKVDSIREIIRLRNFAEEDGIVLPDDDEVLKTIILSWGMLIDGKVYIRPDDIEQEINAIILDAFASGAQVIYYVALFENNSEWMAENFITSEEMLKDYLKENLSQYVYSKTFLLNSLKKTEKEIVTEEIKRVWGDGQTCAVDTLAEKLPFIPKGNIRRVISGNRQFVLASEEVYLRLDRFIISNQEKEEICSFVDKECKEKGFSSLSGVPLGEIPEQNYDLPEVTIYNAIYNLLLADTYQRKDKILTSDGTALDTVSLLKDQIAEREECTFTELAEEVVKLTGGSNRQYAFEALYSNMVRTDLDKFVADKFVNFDVEDIDTILSTMISDHFCAIRDITTFAMFPICGMPWNHYLLESYCYKYSKKFTINVKNFNDRNAGIIVEQGYSKTYNEMLAIAAAKAEITLDPETIGLFLNKVGYLAKSKYGNLGEIAEMAKEIREG